MMHDPMGSDPGTQTDPYVEWVDGPEDQTPDLGWMENYPLHLVKKIAKGGKGIDPEGKRVAVLELQRRLHRRPSAS